jgi:membrane fusion protein (multidrug efflux system)
MNAVTDKPFPASSAPMTTAAARPGRARKRVIQLAVLAVLLAGGAVAFNWWRQEGRFIESTDNAYVQGDIAVLGPRIEGDVVAIHVTDNQAVKAGDPLISLDAADWQLRLDQARDAEAEAAAAIETAQRQVVQAGAAIVTTEAMIGQAEAERNRAEADAGRTGTLATAGWASKQTNETKIADQRKSQALLAAARAA